MNKAKLFSLLREPSTYAGIAAIVISAFGLDSFSPEQITGILAGIAGIFLPEAANKE